MINLTEERHNLSEKIEQLEQVIAGLEEQMNEKSGEENKFKELYFSSQEELRRCDETTRELIKSNELLSEHLSKMKEKMEGKKSKADNFEQESYPEDSDKPVLKRSPRMKISPQDIVPENQGEEMSESAETDIVQEHLKLQSELDRLMKEHKISRTSSSLVSQLKSVGSFFSEKVAKDTKEIEKLQEKFFALESDYVQLNHILLTRNIDKKTSEMEKKVSVLQAEQMQLHQKLLQAEEKNKELQCQLKNSPKPMKYNQQVESKGIFSHFGKDSKVVKEISEKLETMQAELVETYAKLRDTTIKLQQSEERNQRLSQTKVKKVALVSPKRGEDVSEMEDESERLSWRKTETTSKAKLLKTKLSLNLESEEEFVSPKSRKKSKLGLEESISDDTLEEKRRSARRKKESDWQGRYEEAVSVISNYKQFVFALQKKLEQQTIHISYYEKCLKRYTKYLERGYMSEYEEESDSEAVLPTPRKMKQMMREVEEERKEMREVMRILEKNVSKLSNPSLYSLSHKQNSSGRQQEGYWKQKYFKLKEQFSLKKNRERSPDLPREVFGREEVDSVDSETTLDERLFPGKKPVERIKLIEGNKVTDPHFFISRYGEKTLIKHMLKALDDGLHAQVKVVLEKLQPNAREKISLQLISFIEKQESGGKKAGRASSVHILNKMVHYKTQLNMKMGAEEIFFDKVRKLYEHMRRTYTSEQVVGKKREKMTLAQLKQQLKQLEISPSAEEFPYRDCVILLLSFTLQLLDELLKTPASNAFQAINDGEFEFLVFSEDANDFK